MNILPTTLTAYAMDDLLVDLQEQLEEASQPSSTSTHHIFTYLQWDDDLVFRRKMLTKIVTDALKCFKTAGTYPIHERAKDLEKFVRNAGFKDTLSTRDRKCFLLACMNIVYSSLAPDLKESVCMSMKTFQGHFMGATADFQAMSDADWKTALHFRNNLATSLQIVHETGNNLMLVETSSMLAGVFKCVQGSNLGKEGKRFHHILKTFSTTSSPPASPSARCPTPDLNPPHRVSVHRPRPAPAAGMHAPVAMHIAAAARPSLPEVRTTTVTSIAALQDILSHWQADQDASLLESSLRITVTASFIRNASVRPSADVQQAGVPVVSEDDNSDLGLMDYDVLTDSLTESDSSHDEYDCNDDVSSVCDEEEEDSSPCSSSKKRKAVHFMLPPQQRVKSAGSQFEADDLLLFSRQSDYYPGGFTADISATDRYSIVVDTNNIRKLL